MLIRLVCSPEWVISLHHSAKQQNFEGVSAEFQLPITLDGNVRAVYVAVRDQLDLEKLRKLCTN